MSDTAQVELRSGRVYPPALLPSITKRFMLCVSTPSTQGLTLVHVRAQLEQLQDTFMTYCGSYGGRKSSS